MIVFLLGALSSAWARLGGLPGPVALLIGLGIVLAGLGIAAFLAVLIRALTFKGDLGAELDPRGPALKIFPSIAAGKWSSQEFEQSQVVYVENAQRSTPSVAKTVSARVAYRCDEGSEFSLPSACWIARREIGPDQYVDGPRTSVDLHEGEQQPFVLFLVRKDRSIWVYDDRLGKPVGMCGAGRWSAKITISADNTPPVTATVHFLVLPDSSWIPDLPSA